MKTGAKGGIWSKTFGLLFLLTIFDQMAFLCTRAIISTYSLDLGYTESMAGVIAGALSVAAFFSRPLAGRLLTSQGVSHKALLMCSVALSMLVVAAYMVFTDFIPLMIVRILNGVTYGVSGTVELTMASDTLSSENMGRGVGVFGLGNIIGLAVAPSISVWLYDGFGPNVLFGYCLASSVIALFIAAAIPSNRAAKVSRPVRERRKAGLKAIFAPEAVVPSIMNFASQFAYASISAFIVVYGGIKGWDQIGLFYTVYSLALFAFRPINGRLYDKKGLGPLALFGNLSFAFGIFLIAVTDQFWICLLAAVFCGYGYGGAICTFQADAIKSVSPERRGVASGTYFMFNDLGGFIGSTAAGAAVTALGYSRMYLTFMTPLFASIIFYGIVRAVRASRGKQSVG